MLYFSHQQLKRRIMKKIPKTLLTLTPMLLLGTTSPTYAAFRENNTVWWSVEEMIDFYHEVEQEKEAVCGDNQECKMEYDFSLFEKGEKYQALHIFAETQIWLTSINPGEETIKVFYFDEDTMLKYMGIRENISLEQLYFGWVEDWQGQIFNYDHDYFNDGDLPGNHPMYDGNINKNGRNWLPAMEEVELSVAGSNLVNNNHGRIDYAAYAEENKFNAQGSFDYSNCLKAFDYEIGVECKMYVSADQWVAFFPPREDNIEEKIVLTSAGPDWPLPTVEPEPENPEPENPEPEVSELETPEPEEPEQDEPETDNPEPDKPEHNDPAPEIPESETPEPETLESDDPEPETSEPESIEPESIEPETSEPSQPESEEPIPEPSQSELEDQNLEPSQPEEETIEQPETVQSQVDITSSDTEKKNSTPSALGVETPDTGNFPEQQAGNYEEYLTPLLICGAMFIIWWFLPTRSTKNQKKYKS